MKEIKDKPYSNEIALMSGRNLFMDAVESNRFDLAKQLKDMGADINLKCRGSLTLGNALNLAKSEEMITWLLDSEVEIIHCFDLKEKYIHPAVSFSRWLNFEWVEYWRKRERENNLDEVSLHDLDLAIAKTISSMNQEKGLLYLLQNDDIYINEIRPFETNDSMKYTKKALKQISNPEYADRIKEICKKR